MPFQAMDTGRREMKRQSRSQDLMTLCLVLEAYTGLCALADGVRCGLITSATS